MNKYFYINNKKFNYTLEFQSNIKYYSWKHTAPLIEYCETLGINIPHYCYHKGLSISGNCRMCLVELKNSPKPMGFHQESHHLHRDKCWQFRSS